MITLYYIRMGVFLNGINFLKSFCIVASTMDLLWLWAVFRVEKCQAAALMWCQLTRQEQVCIVTMHKKITSGCFKFFCATREFFNEFAVFINTLTLIHQQSRL